MFIALNGTLIKQLEGALAVPVGHVLPSALMGSGHLLDLYGGHRGFQLQLSRCPLPFLCYGPHFTAVETEAERGQITRSRSPSKEGRGKGYGLRCPRVQCQAMSKASAGFPESPAGPLHVAGIFFLSLPEIWEENEAG